jgi:hypothetical protein
MAVEIVMDIRTMAFSSGSFGPSPELVMGLAVKAGNSMAPAAQVEQVPINCLRLKEII